ncbi:MAG TPA: hypothetical protein VN193_09320 [Candidatus Angelobacter sp.]|nr:hypothetical protein [Candidatus Angelobacter sp.]
MRLAVLPSIAVGTLSIQLASAAPAAALTLCYEYSPLDYNHFAYECQQQAYDLTAPKVQWTAAGVVASGRVLELVSGATALGIGNGGRPTAGIGATTSGGFHSVTPAGGNTALDSTATMNGGGYTNGGCVGNATCNNLQLYWNDTAYLNNSSQGPHLHGAAIMSLLDPLSSSDSSNFYDFADTLTNISSDGDTVCALQNVQQASDSRSSPIGLWPTGTTGVGQNTSQSLSLGVNVGGSSAGYNATFNSSAGYISGDIQGPANGNGAMFTGAWYINSDVSGCTKQPTAIESGSAWKTPTSVGNYNYYFSFGTLIDYSN